MRPLRSLSPSCGAFLGLFALAVTVLAATTRAQTLQVGGTVEGIVQDSSGAAVDGAEVVLTNAATGQTRVAHTDERGSFQVSSLPVGTYILRAHHPGFAAHVQTGIQLSIAQTVRLTISLVPAAVTSQVTVTTRLPLIDASQTTPTFIVDTERIEELPVRTRNVLDFVLLAPSVASSGTVAAGASASIGSSGFSFGGLRARSNSVSIDGLDNNDEYAGTSRTELSPEIVREFQVVNNGLSAEYGGASGGSINVVTRDGTNDRHGDAFIFAQSGVLNARDAVESQPLKPQLTRYRAGLSSGGPLMENRTFYYAAAEQEEKTAQDASDMDPSAVSAVNRVLAAGAFWGIPTRQLTSGLFPVARSETEASGKLNHQFSQWQSLMLRYAFTNNREAGDAFDTDGLTDASVRGSSFTRDHALAGSLVSVLTPHAVNDLRFQVAARRVTLRTNASSGPEIDIDGLARFGRPYEGNSRRRENHYEIADTLALSHGSHLLKAGGVVNRVHLASDAPDGFGGIYAFADLDDFLAGRPDFFRQAFGDPDTGYQVTSYGSFFQEHWTVSRGFTVDLGLRYDFEHLPHGFNQDTNNLSPRVGIAYSPAARWVVRAGFGILYDRYVLAYLNRAIEKDGAQRFEQIAYGAAATSIFQRTAGGSAREPLSGVLPSVYRADPHLATAYSEQMNAEAERQLSANTFLSANYLHVRGVKLSRIRNVNLMTPVVLTRENAGALGITNPAPQQLGRYVFGPRRLDPRLDALELLEDSASSSCQGFTLALNHRLANEIEFTGSYTLARTLDDASDFDEQPQNPYSLREDWSTSRNSQRQRFVFSGLFELPFGKVETSTGQAAATSVRPNARRLEGLLAHIELAPIVTLESGRPMNALTGLDSNRSGAYPFSARPLGFKRNSLVTPGMTNVDLRLLKYFPFGKHARLDLVAEFFNLFNHTNVVQINSLYGNELQPLPGFRQPTQALNARQIQFSVDFEY
jgi:hypothetical protein